MHVLLQRKINVNGAEWLAQLVRWGLVSKSFLPPPAIRDRCELVRHRRTLLETRTAARNEGLSFPSSLPGALDCDTRM